MAALASQSRVEPNGSSEVVEALRVGLGDRLISVVLFGSQARQEGRDGSDWDLLVIAEGLPWIGVRIG